MWLDRVRTLAVARAVALAAVAAVALAAPETGHGARPLAPCERIAEPPLSVVHLFDWYGRDTINGPYWTHRVDWASYGLTASEVGSSRAFYDVQLELVQALGVDGVAYEFFDEGVASDEFLSSRFLASLHAHELKIALFYDLELEQVFSVGPVLSAEGYIHPTETAAGLLASKIADFYQRVPRSDWLIDRDGRLPMLVYGFGFDQSATDPDAWDRFYSALLYEVADRLGVKPVIYWSAINRLQVEVAYQHFPQQIRPFNFVLDTPQPQLAPGAVTWNVNFDNLGVQREYGLLRVIRDDPRYLQEMLWLAKRTSPELLFVYSWNEFYEGANLMPDQTYGTSRYELVQKLLAEVAADHSPRLPCTLLIVDDYADALASPDADLAAEEALTLYPLRRLAPQADVRLAEDVTPELLGRYDMIVMLAQRSPQALQAVARALPDARVVLLGPAAASSSAQAWFRKRLRKGDDWWVRTLSPTDRLLARVFTGVYARPLEPGIMYGEAFRSQRLEISADGRVFQNTFEAPAAFEHEALPAPWTPPPPAQVPGAVAPVRPA